VVGGRKRKRGGVVTSSWLLVTGARFLGSLLPACLPLKAAPLPPLIIPPSLHLPPRWLGSVSGSPATSSC
jgi:hypothetical protein